VVTALFGIAPSGVLGFFSPGVPEKYVVRIQILIAESPSVSPPPLILMYLVDVFQPI
jgi:hypothetical protein